MDFLNNKTLSSKLSLDPGVTEYIFHCKHKNNINLIVHLHQKAQVTKGIDNEQQYCEKNFFLSSDFQQWAYNIQ
jgi:hypothetical protein